MLPLVQAGWSVSQIWDLPSLQLHGLGVSPSQQSALNSKPVCEASRCPQHQNYWPLTRSCPILNLKKKKNSNDTTKALEKLSLLEMALLNIP